MENFRVGLLRIHDPQISPPRGENHIKAQGSRKSHFIHGFVLFNQNGWRKEVKVSDPPFLREGGGTLPETNIAMENPPIWWYLPGKMGIFMGYVSFREVSLFLSRFGLSKVLP